MLKAIVLTLIAALPSPSAVADAAAESTATQRSAAAGSSQTSTATTERAVSAAPIYKPPRLGAPKTRVGGGTRGSTVAPSIVLLAPPHTGLTSEAQPTLHWHLSAPYEGELEFVLTTLEAVEPSLRHRVSSRYARGFHRLDLAEHDVELAPGTVYQWSVAIIRDRDRRARDVVAIATIERTNSVAARSAAAQAAAGVWYDAIATVTEEGAHAARQALLDQVGLGTATMSTNRADTATAD